MAIGVVTGLAISACAVFPNPVVGLGGRSTASMNTALTPDDVRMADAALAQAIAQAPDGSGTTWANPRTGSSGAFRVVQTFQDAFGRTCRGYQETVNVAGSREGYTVSACRDANGQWQRLEAL
jgi:surface antigen